MLNNGFDYVFCPSVVKLREGFIHIKRRIFLIQKSLQKRKSDWKICRIKTTLAERIDGSCCTVGKNGKRHVFINEKLVIFSACHKGEIFLRIFSDFRCYIRFEIGRCRVYGVHGKTNCIKTELERAELFLLGFDFRENVIGTSSFSVCRKISFNSRLVLTELIGFLKSTVALCLKLFLFLSPLSLYKLVHYFPLFPPYNILISVSGDNFLILSSKFILSLSDLNDTSLNTTFKGLYLHISSIIFILTLSSKQATKELFSTK